MKLNIGENIRNCRRKMNLTQEQLAEKLGVSFQSVSRWENDLTYPDTELLPVLSKIFGITTDDLLGVPQVKKEQEMNELLKELRELSNREDAPAERIMELIREIRRSFLNEYVISHVLYSVNPIVYRRFPEILPEMRLTMEQAMESEELDMLDKSNVIELMSIIEDDEHIEKFLQRYTSEKDTSRYKLLRKRCIKWGDWDKYEPIRQLELKRCIEEVISNDSLWINFGRPRDLDNNLMLVQLQIDFLHRLCGKIPDKAHPVSANGELDFWVYERVMLGLKLSCRLTAAGRIEDAYTALEDTVSLLEKGMTITEQIELRCSSPFLQDISYTAAEDWFDTDLNEFEDQKQERGICMTDNIYNSFLFPSKILKFMNDERGWEWFNLIREDERFKAYLSRVEKLIVYRDKPTR